MIGKTIATLTFAAASVNAHGYLKTPPARNVAKTIIEHETFEPQSLPAGGPGDVFENGGYRHGMCGDSHKNQYQKWNIPGENVATYTEGQIIKMSAVITAHHLGFFEAQLCDTQDITEECFYNHRLMRPGCTDEYDEECFRVWKPLLSTEVNTWSMSGFKGNIDVVDRSSSNIFETEFEYEMVLPQDVTCTHCVLRWHWFTTNSCEPTSNGQSGTSEEFWNCADVRVQDVNTRAAGGELSDAERNLLIKKLTEDRPRDMYSPELRSENMWRFCPTQSYPTDPTLFMVASCPTCEMKTVDAENYIPEYNNNNNNVASDYRCGNSWDQANNECHSTCSTNDDCPSGMQCYAGVADICDSADSTTTSSDASTTTSSDAPTTTSSAAETTTTTTSSAACGTCRGCLRTFTTGSACYANWDAQTCERYIPGNTNADFYTACY